MILNYLRKIRDNRRERLRFDYLNRYGELPTDNVYQAGFNIDVRKPLDGMKYVKVGHNCVLAGSYVFETETGTVTIGDRVHIGGSVFICRSSIEIE